MDGLPASSSRAPPEPVCHGNRGQSHCFRARARSARSLSPTVPAYYGDRLAAAARWSTASRRHPAPATPRQLAMLILGGQAEHGRAGHGAVYVHLLAPFVLLLFWIPTEPQEARSIRYRVSERFTVGLRYLYQYFHYGTGGSDVTNSGFLTAHWDVKQYASLDLYGGPSDSAALGTSSFVPVVNETSGTFNSLSPAFGGTFSLRSDDTVFNVSAQHLVSSGGGLLMTVTSDYEGAELRRQLGANWDFIVTGGYAHTVALQSQTSKGKADTQSFATAFERPLLEKLSVHFEYDYLRQRVNQFVPLGSNVNENEFSISLFYRIGAAGR